jgi:hypothetical protein
MGEFVKLRALIATTCLAFLAGCATTPQTAGPEYAPAAGALREARSSQVPVEKRTADYLQVAAMTTPPLGTGTEATPARATYNAACNELTLLLSSAGGGRLPDHPLTVSNGSATYRLHFQPASYGVWAPDYFTSFKLPSLMKNEGRVKTINEVRAPAARLSGYTLRLERSSRHRVESVRRSRPHWIFTGMM